MEAKNERKDQWEYKLPLFKSFKFDSINLGTLRILIAVYCLVFVAWFFICITGIIDELNSSFFDPSVVFKILFFFIFGTGVSYIVYWGLVMAVVWIRNGYKNNT